MQKIEEIKDKRNYGIDLLRILAGFYVIVLHAFGRGGVLENLPEETVSFRVVWMLEIISYSAVNIFVLISGFNSITEKERKNDWSGIICLWLEVVYYSFFVYIILSLVKGFAIRAESVWKYFFPILNNGDYWFFSSYICLFFLKPIIDKGIRNTDELQMKTLIGIFFLFISVYSVIRDPFFLILGQSPFWFVILYIIGAGIKKCQFDKKFSNIQLIVLLIVMILITWVSKCYGRTFYIFNHRIHDRTLISSYTSPTELGSAVLHVLIFSKLNIPAFLKKTIRFAAPSVFAIYLINTHPLYWNYELNNKFLAYAPRRISVLLPKIMIYSISFFCFAILIDKIRQFIFQKFQIREKIYKLLYTHK